MKHLNAKTSLQATLTQKQELVRDYQSLGDQISNAEVSKMYYHFAEAEALHSKQISDQLAKLN